MNIILTSVDDALAEAWRTHCGDFPGVTVHQGSIFDVKCDALVSPANSFGFMDGGIDMLYSIRLGWHVQFRLQRIIKERHHGELLVGCAEVVPTDIPEFPYVIAAPTMRVPTTLVNSVNPYLAARAVFLLIKHGTFVAGPLVGQPISNTINTVAFPGLGTGVGKVGPNTCAHQLRLALEEVIAETVAFPSSWADAAQKHKQMYLDTLGDPYSEPPAE
jgi:O-acetyl-ADP-ribose deacetylase (regulator of RNase III)